MVSESKPKWKSKYIQVSGIRTHYLETNSNSKETFLLIHGGGPEDCAELTWHLSIEKLSEIHKVIAPDLLGFGETEGDVYDLLTRTEHLYSFIRMLDLKNFIIVGHSQGSFLATKIALQHPGIVSSLVIVAGGSVAPLGNFDSNNKLSNGLRTLLAYIDNTSPDSFKRRWEHVLYDCSTAEKRYLDRFYKRSVTRPSFLQYTEALKQFRNNHFLGHEIYEKYIAPEMPNNKVDSLIVWGKDDDFSFWWRGTQILDKMPKTELLVLDRCKHYVMLDRATALNDTLMRLAR